MKTVVIIISVIMNAIAALVAVGSVGESIPDLWPSKPEPETVIQVDDLLNLFVYRDETLTNEYRVEESGEITLPFVGGVAVAGRSVCQVEEIVEEKLTGILKEPCVEVQGIAREPGRIEVFLAGGGPTQGGAFSLAKSETLLQFLARTGSIDGTRNLSRVSIFRQSGETCAVNVTHILESGDRSCDIELTGGDVVYLSSENQNSFEILGHVVAAGSYSISEPISIFSALALAGGLTDSAAYKSIRIRSLDGMTRQVNLALSLSGSSDVPVPMVQPGDIVFVPKSLFYHWKSFMGALIPIGTGNDSLSEKISIINGGSIRLDN